VGPEGFLCGCPPELERIKDWNIGTLECWKDDKNEEGNLLDFSDPVFHPSTLPLFQKGYGV